MNKILITKSFEETRKIGEDLAKEIKKGVIICLYGELGGGKTTFIQGFAKGLGIKGRIISPTFIILRSYKIRKQNFFHVDLYRTQGVNDIKTVGIEELISNENNTIAIEWAEKLENLLPKKRIDVFFEDKGEEQRKILI